MFGFSRRQLFKGLAAIFGILGIRVWTHNLIQ
jgi:hypothetical protein